MRVVPLLYWCWIRLVFELYSCCTRVVLVWLFDRIRIVARCTYCIHNVFDLCSCCIRVVLVLYCCWACIVYLPYACCICSCTGGLLELFSYCLRVVLALYLCWIRVVCE